VPVINGKADYSNAATFARVGEIGQRLGLEWGGMWKTFPDRPHFQFLAGYTLADFQNKKIDEQKFAFVPAAPVTVSTAPLVKPPAASKPPVAIFKVTASVLNVRSGPSRPRISDGRAAQGTRGR
jgi:hypothetical protein